MASGNGSATSAIPHSEQRAWVPDERDALIAWLRGEFAAANAIIDALCQHLQIMGGPGEYDHVLNCILQRRYNWNPVLHMQQYYSIAEVLLSLQQVAVTKQLPAEGESGTEKVEVNGNHKDCEEAVKVLATKEEASKRSTAVPQCISGFEEIDGQQVNVMEGLRLYDDVFDGAEAARISALVSESHAGKRRSKGNKRSKSKGKEVIHFGTLPSEVPAGPVFKEEAAEPMPAFLESMIDRLVKSQVIPASKRPDACSISVLEAGDYMPPHNHRHFDQPVFILSLGSASTLAFGRNLKMSANSSSAGEIDAKYKVTVSVGSVLVLQGNSAELVQCAVPALQSTRTLVTFGSMPKSSAKRPSPPLRSLSISPSLPRTGATSSSTPAIAAGTVAAYPVTTPVMVPVTSAAQPVVLAATSVPFSPVAVVAAAAVTPSQAAAWSTSPGLARVPSPGTGVFLPASNGTVLYNTHHQMNGSNRRNHFDAARKAVVA